MIDSLLIPSNRMYEDEDEEGGGGGGNGGLRRLSGGLKEEKGRAPISRPPCVR